MNAELVGVPGLTSEGERKNTVSLCSPGKKLEAACEGGRRTLEPSPQGVFLVVCLRTLVGMRTGPLTRRSLSLARLTRSLLTCSQSFLGKGECKFRPGRRFGGSKGSANYLFQVLDVVLGSQSDSDLVALGLRSIVVLGVFAGDVTHLCERLVSDAGCFYLNVMQCL